MTPTDRPILIYVDPFNFGHRVEHLAFYMRVCAAIGVTLSAHVPARLWNDAGRLVRGLDRSAEFGRDIFLPDPTMRGRLGVIRGAERAAVQRRASLIYFSMLDDFLVPLSLRLMLGRRMAAPWSGVLFRDGFNYPQDETRWPSRRLKSHLKLAVLRRALQRDTPGILTLNPAWRTPMPAPVRWLPDALSSVDRIAEQASQEAGGWPLPKVDAGDGRLKLLIFGAMQPRKGLAEIVRGLLRLDDPELARIELRALGRFPREAEDYRAAVEEDMRVLARRGARVELVAEYVSETSIDQALRRADVLLAPYLHHMGSSGVLGLAAQYGRPILTQETYQMGEEVRGAGMGLTVDPTDPDAVAAAIRRMLAKEIGVSEGMRAMRDSRSASQAFEMAKAAMSAMIRPTCAR